MVIYTHPDATGYATPAHPESPARILNTVSYLEDFLPGCEWRRPRFAALESLLLAHTEAHWKRLRVPEPFDGDTPHHPGIDEYARLATGAALDAVDRALEGTAAFSLMRPPGHHATADQAMGFCYLNHVAVAALAARAGGLERVAVWDFDAHHGNGTEDLLLGREGVLFVSVHQLPGYPGSGAEHRDNCRNYPVVPETPAERHLGILRESWEEVLAFEPGLILVSAGFDAYAGDPITQMCLRQEDFLVLGQWVHAAPCPVAAILEGGYSSQLPYLVGAFLEGWNHG
ncbi:MAG: histone deacetylase [Puniceicoccaceae bacterium]|nr:MAG: histone deacetylase [Puniceicoccaceae bacterium]